MPAEWEPHAGCLMAWPSRVELWGARVAEAKHGYAAVAGAIAAFEPVVMVCNPGLAGEVAAQCGHGVSPIEIPINDSWCRDSGPAFVRNAAGEIAVVGFGFNAWGNRWHPHDDDARLSERLAEWLELPFFKAPFVLEAVSDHTSPECSRGQANFDVLSAACDASGRAFEIAILDPGPTTVSYANATVARVTRRDRGGRDHRSFRRTHRCPSRTARRSHLRCQTARRPRVCP